MQNARTSSVVNALIWLENTYSSLKIDAYAIIVAVTLLIVLLCAGAYQEAIRQAHLSLGVAPLQDAGAMQIVDMVNQYGLALLVAVCYFSNATNRGVRRELFIDGVSIALGVLLPQLVFHATTVWTMQEIVVAHNIMASPGIVSVLNLEWLIVWGLSMLVVGLAFVTWRAIHRPGGRSARER